MPHSPQFQTQSSSPMAEPPGPQQSTPFCVSLDASTSFPLMPSVLNLAPSLMPAEGGAVTPPVCAGPQTSHPDLITSSSSLTGAASSVLPQFRVEGSMNLYISQVPASYNSTKLRDAFAKFGPIHSAKVMFDPLTNESRCFGFVLFESSEDGARAMSLMNGVVLEEGSGRLHVRVARPTALPQPLRGEAPSSTVFTKQATSHQTQERLTLSPSQAPPVIFPIQQYIRIGGIDPQQHAHPVAGPTAATVNIVVLNQYGRNPSSLDNGISLESHSLLGRQDQQHYYQQLPQHQQQQQTQWAAATTQRQHLLPVPHPQQTLASLFPNGGVHTVTKQQQQQTQHPLWFPVAGQQVSQQQHHQQAQQHIQQLPHLWIPNGPPVLLPANSPTTPASSSMSQSSGTLFHSPSGTLGSSGTTQWTSSLGTPSSLEPPAAVVGPRPPLYGSHHALPRASSFSQLFSSPTGTTGTMASPADTLSSGTSALAASFPAPQQGAPLLQGQYYQSALITSPQQPPHPSMLHHSPQLHTYSQPPPPAAAAPQHATAHSQQFTQWASSNSSTHLLPPPQ
jgi:hypothetical protein